MKKDSEIYMAQTIPFTQHYFNADERGHFGSFNGSEYFRLILLNG